MKKTYVFRVCVFACVFAMARANAGVARCPDGSWSDKCGRPVASGVTYTMLPAASPAVANTSTAVRHGRVRSDKLLLLKRNKMRAAAGK